MAREVFTDEQIEFEVERLKDSKYVRMAQKEIRIKNKKRQWFYQLRWLEKRGKQLEEQGITLEDMEEQLAALEGVERDYDI